MLIFGERKYAMRVWLDPVRMAARSLTATDVLNALNEQNVEIPSGQLGQPPSDAKQAFEIPVRVVGRLTSPEQFDNIVVKNTANGLVLLKDVGHAEIGAEDYGSTLEYQGHSAMGFGVQLLSNANAIDVDRRAKVELARLSKSFPPGLEYAIAFDSTTAVGESIQEVLTNPWHLGRDRHRGHLPLPASLARDDHPCRYHSCVADWHLRLHENFRLLD